MKKLFKNVENGCFYQIVGNKVFMLSKDVNWWRPHKKYRPADLIGYPFIDVNSTNC